MGIFDYFFKREKRQNTITSFFQGGSTQKRITADNALTLTAVYACVKVISETIATLPLNLYVKDGDERNIATTHSLQKLLKNNPNDYMNFTQLMEAVVTSALLRGNAYLHPVRTRSGEILEIEFLNSANVSIDDMTSKIFYKYSSANKNINFNYDELVNIPYFTLDGIRGITPIEKCRTALELANVSEEFGKQFYENSAMPSGIIEIPGQFENEETLKRFRNAWNKNYGGGNKFQTGVLEGGATFKTISLNNKDAQFLEGRQFSIQDIARMFLVPPHMIGDLSRATFSNIEHQAIQFEKYTIRPLVTKIEAAFNQRLLTENEKENYFFKFNTSALLRGDMKSRYESYNIGRNAGFLSVNDIRKLEDLNPVDGGDIYLQPLNMENIGEKNEE